MVLGEFDLSEHEGTEQPRRVSTALWHPLYDLRTRSHDVMLLRLAEPVLFTPYVRPVPLPVNCPATGTYCTVSGWGNTAGDGCKSHFLGEWVPERERESGVLEGSPWVLAFAPHRKLSVTSLV